MKELLSDRERYVLETKMQLLESNGVRCVLKRRYNRKYYRFRSFITQENDWILYCDEADFDKAHQILDEIDTTAFDDGEELRDKKGRTAEQAIRDRVNLEKNIARVGIWILIILVIAAIIYNSR